MALLSKLGTVNVPSSVGTQVVHVGFQPKVLIVYTASLAGNTSSNQTSINFGFATGPTEQVVTSFHLYTGQSADNRRSTEHIINAGGAFTKNQASLTSLDADGFTLIWQTIGSEASGLEYQYLALGGDDILNAKAFDGGTHTSRGLKKYTTGFKPNFMAFAPARDIGGQAPWYGLGMASPNGVWSVAGSHNYGSSGAGSRMYDTFATFLQIATGSVYGNARISSYDPDGFTLDYTSTPFPDAYLHTLAIEFKEAPKVGWFYQPDSTLRENGFSGTSKALWLAGRASNPSALNLAEMRFLNVFSTPEQTVSHLSIRPSWVGLGSAQRYGEYITHATATSSVPYIQPLTRGTISHLPDGFDIHTIESTTRGQQVGYVSFLEAPIIGEVREDTYSIEASSEIAVEPHRLRLTSLEQMDSASGIDLTTEAIREASITESSSLGVTVEALKTSEVSLNVDLVANIDIQNTRERQATLTEESLSGVVITPMVRREASFEFDMDSTMRFTTEGYQTGEFHWRVDSTCAFVGTLEAVGAFSIAAQSALDLEQNRIQTGALSLTWNADLRADATRVRTDGMTTHAVAALVIDPISLRQGVYRLHNQSGVDLTHSSERTAFFTMMSALDMTYRAKPRLVKTYEHVAGNVSSRLPQGEVQGLPQGRVHRLPQGRVREK